jgi:hypothetical protein
MGESAFSQWCASAGLTANNSNVDETGWDFFVEFDFHAKASLLSTVHEAAFECKVQVKSTDNQNRKLAVKLSNLKRLATAAMPAFIVFIEFDGKELPQRVFLVHVDELLTSKILSRLHEVEQREENNLLHKKTLTITYNESHLLADASGGSMAAAMRNHMGDRMSDYVARKNEHLASAGFDEGFAEMSFSAEGIESISKLIDMSIGIESQADVSEFVAFKKRFGRTSTMPFLHHQNVKIEMHDLKPNFEGKLKFKSDRLGAAYSFPAKLFLSPFDVLAPEDLRKCRIAGGFFDFVFNPYTNACTYTFSLGDKKFDIRTLQHALKCIEMLSNAGQRIYSELVIDGFPPMKFEINSPGINFGFQRELDAVEAGLKILSLLGITNPVEISIAEANGHASRMVEMATVLNADSKSFRVDIPATDEPLAVDEDLICLSFFSTPVGDVWIGTFVTMTGRPYPSAEGGYSVFSTTRTIERIVVLGRGEEIPSKELIAATETIEQKFQGQFEVLTLFDKNQF